MGSIGRVLAMNPPPPPPHPTPSLFSTPPTTYTPTPTPTHTHKAHRVAKLKEMGCNAWRTAHNAPTPALLDAADRLGFLVWDENHRNGQDDELTRLVLRDRNHPSIIIWSICNEKLCDSSDTLNDAHRLHDLFHSLDPRGARVVSANYVRTRQGHARVEAMVEVTLRPLPVY